MATVHSSTDIQVAVTDTNYVAFASQICRAVDVINNTTVDINVRRQPSNIAFLVKAGSYKKVDGIENANQVEVARAASSGAITVQATVYA